MEQSLVVGMAEIKALRVGPTMEQGAYTTLTALGLGSCVAVCLYDASARVAGMAHVVLPESGGNRGEPPGKFADTVVPALIDEMVRFGAARRRLVAAIAGGSQLFAFSTQAAGTGIGERNAACVQQALRDAGVPLLAQEVGGNQGRTVRLSAVDGRVSVKTIGQTERQLVVLGDARPMAARPAA